MKQPEPYKKVLSFLGRLAPDISTIYGGPDKKTPYMTRIRWAHHRIHIFHRGDEDPDHHDHPFDFTTFPLTSYVEEVRDGAGVYMRVVRAFRIHRRDAEFAHRVIGPWSGETYVKYGERRELPTTRSGKIITLVWYSDLRREWGFWCRNATKWIPWKDYTRGTHRC